MIIHSNNTHSGVVTAGVHRDENGEPLFTLGANGEVAAVGAKVALEALLKWWAAKTEPDRPVDVLLREIAA